MLFFKLSIHQRILRKDTGRHLSIYRKNDRRSERTNQLTTKFMCDSWNIHMPPIPSYERLYVDKCDYLTTSLVCQDNNLNEQNAVIIQFSTILNAAQFQLTQKLAYTSWDLTWDLIVATAHVHIDKFQVLRWNDHTPNFLSYVHYINEAHCFHTSLTINYDNKKGRLSTIAKSAN